MHRFASAWNIVNQDGVRETMDLLHVRDGELGGNGGESQISDNQPADSSMGEFLVKTLIW